jgi:hypothetical protein
MSTILAIYLCAFGGLMLALLWLRQTIVPHVRRQWERAGANIQFSPVGATCYGTTPRRDYHSESGHYGALGIANDHLAFLTRYSIKTAVLLACVRWIGFRRITVKRGKGTKKIDALIVHADLRDGWHVFAFESNQSYRLAQELGARCGLPVRELGTERESYGPFPATRVTQDIYGAWHEDAWESLLFLAPDRLLYSGTAIPLATIRQVGAFENGTLARRLTPFPRDLLRIEYRTPQDKPQTVGFLVRRADDWADAIRRRSPARIAVSGGRKKKAS